MKFEYDVLPTRSAETKRQLDELVRDDVALLEETPRYTATSGATRSRLQRIRARLARLGGSS